MGRLAVAIVYSVFRSLFLFSLFPLCPGALVQSWRNLALRRTTVLCWWETLIPTTGNCTAVPPSLLKLPPTPLLKTSVNAAAVVVDKHGVIDGLQS